MTFNLEPLPFPEDSLKGFISPETLSFHYGKHHKNYVDTLNRLVKGTPYEGMTLEEVITYSNKNRDLEVFNNAGQVWNHQFFWNCLSSKEFLMGNSVIGKMVKKKFGSYGKFVDEFTKQALSLFGSGWVWLLLDDDGDHTYLEIVSTGNGDTPIATWGMKPLLVLDVWEHAYYLDHKNSRKEYVKKFFEYVNWEFVEQNVNP